MERSRPEIHRYRAASAKRASVWRAAWPIVRQVLGWICIFLGILGLVLPGPGLLLLSIGIALVGRRHPVIRLASAHFKLFLRRWATLQTPLLGSLGRLALRGQQQAARQCRRLHWRYTEYWQQRSQRGKQPGFD